MFEILFLVLMLSSAAKVETWTPDDHLKVKSVGNVQVSPDGRRVAFTVTEQVIEPERSESRTHIWLARSDGSESFQLTRGEKSCTEPRWSPDEGGSLSPARARVPTTYGVFAPTEARPSRSRI